ncbi:glycoside hydrolase family 27 protein [uncultured Paludibaculum sp.]|uniref:glycoside hydrolase family 27 protein n=1 Tax=uncultured Paludibaculum sp. TaxID=1765020 RepID=UPI002AAAAE2B|nr:glycoside hydrolase family 27 protein [uncultured Paludibaculum sp.]
MKPLAVLTLLAFPCLAADLTGSWVAQRQGPGGRVMETQLNFKQEGSTFTGSMLSSMGEQKILNGKIDGETFSFEVVQNMMGQERRVKWEGKVDGEQLKLTMNLPAMGPGGPPPGGGAVGPGPAPGGGFRGMREMTARRGESEAIKKELAAEAKRPKPVLPDRKILPPNGLAKTPPMGWNSWNKFHANISDKLIREVADALASSGLRDAGYVYLTIDDGWIAGRDENGRPKPNDRFPDMKGLGDYIHSKGLKFGIYSSPGSRTCQQLEGSLGYEAMDAKVYASWGIDYLKYDWCGAARTFTVDQQAIVYQMMAELLRATGRPILYSISQYGQGSVLEWASGIGANMWRTTGDIRDTYESMTTIGFGQSGKEKFSGPGHWNDPDMLEIGNGGLNPDESRTHMSLWAILAAPLIAGNDVRSMDKDTIDVLTNRDVLAVSQDPLGKQGYRLQQNGDIDIWVRPLKGGEWAVGLFNRGRAAVPAKVAWQALGLKGKPKVRDLWAHAEVESAVDGYTATVPAHGVALLRIRP